jgi:hypothetical protein
VRKWLYDRPWIWVVLFLSTLIAASLVTVIIAEVNKPEIVKPKAPRKARGAAQQSLAWQMGEADSPAAAESATRPQA